MSRASVWPVALILALVALPVLAVDGQIPIPNTTVYATPIVITTPGSYVVTRNLTPTGPGPIIDIAVPAFPGGDVVLELNGHLLDNTLNPGAPVIRISVLGSSEATVRNGSLVGGTAGIEAIGPSQKVVIEDVKIGDFTGSGTSPAGIYLFDVENVVIRRSVVQNTTAGCGAGVGGQGIWLDGGIPRQGTIEDNIVRRTCDGIVLISGQGVEISNNRLLEIAPGSFGAGIHVDTSFATLLAQNTIHTVFGPAPSRGIAIVNSKASKLYNNLIDNTLEFGILLDPGSSGALVLNNIVRGAAVDGLRVDGSANHIERNVLNGNGAGGTGFGLHFTAGAIENTYSRNTGVANIGPPPVCVFPVSADFCDDNSPPPGPPNGSLFDNLMPPSAGPF